ncbi:hypothetical protein [Pseudomonas sp. PSKL.D1]|uniref:hypothetical protein n=1 Tax=Pseudomonas sp. PSKL.D1 TaxID=3029060 RepID=UPI002380FBBB|nr:hypothetical protein [Pseudomonas sp. PSKL.D1]WDY60007.1 hypothetical protein PVV54_10430 [Pseudomonas sp. PSKL.D1]
MKLFLALALLALIAAAALLGSPWMSQRFHMPEQKTSAHERKTAGPHWEPAVFDSV